LNFDCRCEKGRYNKQKGAKIKKKRRKSEAAQVQQGAKRRTRAERDVTLSARLCAQGDYEGPSPSLHL